jgi:hypothetical protein
MRNNSNKEAIRKEVWDLTKGTGTLVPVSDEEVKAMKKYWQIGTTLKCKRKKKDNGFPAPSSHSPSTVTPSTHQP